MNIIITYNKEEKQITIQINEEESQELTFEILNKITNEVIDKNVSLIIETHGFEEYPDIEKNYKEIFEKIENLKNDPEIVELKKFYQETKNDEELGI